MKSTGIVRKLDNLGRIVIPIELRKTMNIALKDSLEIFTEGDDIVIRKYAPGCIFCGEATDTTMLHDKRICANCIREIQNRPTTLPEKGVEHYESR